MANLKNILPILLFPMLLSACNGFGHQFTCSSDDSKSTTLDLIKESMEKAVAERSKDEEGNSLATSSAIRAALSQIKMSIENIRTTKKDPNSTMQFCSGTLKVVYPIKVLKDADETREIAKLDSVSKLTDQYNIERNADYLTTDISYTIQPTDDGEKVFADVEDIDDKINVFSEILSSSMLNPMWKRIKKANIADEVSNFRDAYLSNADSVENSQYYNEM